MFMLHAKVPVAMAVLCNLSGIKCDVGRLKYCWWRMERLYLY